MKRVLLCFCLARLFAQAPVHVDYTCPAEDMESFGLLCSEDQPCPIFFEVSAVDSMAGRIFVAGDIHTSTTTLWGVLLSTEDGGASWAESVARLRSVVFDQFQFIGERAWLSGHREEPLAKDPFFLMTTDGGKSWSQKALFEESRFGSITQFWFDSPDSGKLIFDDSVGKAVDQEMYATMSGGDSWEMQQKSQKALSPVRGAGDGWSVTAPAGSKSYLLERVVKGKKEVFARILIHIGDCK